MQQKRQLISQFYNNFFDVFLFFVVFMVHVIFFVCTRWEEPKDPERLNIVLTTFTLWTGHINCLKLDGRFMKPLSTSTMIWIT